MLEIATKINFADTLLTEYYSNSAHFRNNFTHITRYGYLYFIIILNAQILLEQGIYGGRKKKKRERKILHKNKHLNFLK